jgi:aminomethyltransferase
VTEVLLRTPLHSRQANLGGRFVPFAGWEMPVQFAGVTREHQTVRTQVGLFDVSHMGELWLQGAGAEAALDAIVTGDVRALASGRAAYTVACNELGTILDDLIVYRLGPQRFLVVCNASNRAKIAAHFATHCSGRCSVTDGSDDCALLALQGPMAEPTLAALPGGPDFARLPRFGVAGGTLAGVSATLARTGYTGEDGFELFCAPSDAGTLWDAVMGAGAAHGIAPIGLGARDTLRLEARLMLYGNDIDEATTPFEAGIGWTVKLDKGDFIGRAALLEAKARGPSKKLVGFEMLGRGIARHGYPVMREPSAGSDGAVGVVTSGAPGLTVGKNIGLAYVPVALSGAGTPLYVSIRGQAVEAIVVPTPFYKRKP